MGGEQTMEVRCASENERTECTCMPESVVAASQRRVAHLHAILRPAASDENGFTFIPCENEDEDDNTKFMATASTTSAAGGVVDSPSGFVERFEAPCEHVATLFDNFEASVRARPMSPFLGTRELKVDGTSAGKYVWETYSEASSTSRAIGSGLLALGIPAGAHVGIYSVNCREWVLCDLACHAFSMVDVPLYDTLGADAVSYITNHAELQAICCSSAVLPTLLESIKTTKTPSLRLIVVYASWGSVDPPQLPGGPGADDPTGALAGVAAPPASLSSSHASSSPPSMSSLGVASGGSMPAASGGVRIVRLADVIAVGRMRPAPCVPPSPQSPATICYTSGTTGTPKGVVLTHANMIANSAGTSRAVRLRSDDVAISYLPLAHIYERVNAITMIHFGSAIGFYKGDVLELLDDIVELKPTLFSSVPRLWNRIYDRIQGQLNESGFVKKMLFRAAFSAGCAALKKKRPAPFWTKPIFGALKARLGGRVRLMITGASPLAADIMEFLRVCFATTVEGYGMTETAMAISITSPDDPTTGHVGYPLKCSEIKLEDIPEMRYHNSDKPYPRGEICVRGPSVFHSYYKNPKETAEVIDADGWFHTGDVGMIIPGGKLKIIDRKKNIFKLAQGEYVAPEKIENVYVKCPLVAQAMVYGDSLKHKLVAVVVPDPEVLVPWAVGKKIIASSAPGSIEALCRHPVVVSAVLKQMLKQGEDAGLNGFEQVFAIHLEPVAWTVESGFLTPTMKIKRPILRDAYQAQIDRMYASLRE